MRISDLRKTEISCSTGCEKKDLTSKIISLKEQIAVLQAKNNTLHVYNNVTDNQLSSLKHETMYYPSRIMQMIDADADKEELSSVVYYYRELYALLLKQMNSNGQRAQLFPVRKCNIMNVIPGTVGGVTIINEELIYYLLLLIKRHNDSVTPVYKVQVLNENYYEVNAVMSNFKHQPSVVPEMFTSLTCDADFLIMRQIIREIGSASNHHGCGISSELKNGNTIIKFTLPKNTNI